MALCFLAAMGTVCALANSSVVAKPAKDRSTVFPTAKPAPIRTDLAPENKNECFAVGADTQGTGGEVISADQT
jgi:hypothetical protein